MREAKIAVRHTVQMGHRLWSLPGQCTQLHGHTWDVTLTIAGPRDEDGLMMDYHVVKKIFREYLDLAFDHRLCLHIEDPLLTGDQSIDRTVYPGLVVVDFLPSTENLSEFWATRMQAQISYQHDITVGVWEGDKNYAEVTIPRKSL